MAASYVPLTPRQHQINRMIWIGIGVTAFIDIALLWITGVGVDMGKAHIFVPVFIGCFALSAFYRYVRRDDQIYLLGQITAQMLAATATLGIMSYVTARLNLPLIDEQLIAIDRFFYFDWKAYIGWIDQHPLLAKTLSLAYISSGPQILVLICTLFVMKQSPQIQRFILVYLTSALITIVLAMLFPAVAGYVHYNIDILTYQHLDPAAMRIHEEPLMGMRNHSTDMLMFPLKGLVTFPSFHSTLSIALIYASWPIRKLRWIFIPLNILVLMSTPVDGGHYFIDVLGGVAIAIGCIWLAEKLFPRSA